MKPSQLTLKIEKILQTLCFEHPHRRVGAPGNRAATDFFSQVLTSYGFRTRCEPFDCIDWVHGEVELVVDGQTFDAFVSPYSLGCNQSGRLVSADTVGTLEAVDAAGNMLFLHGDLTKEQLMPKNFPFYNPEHHQKIVALLEKKAPGAIIAATTRDPGLAGGVYPFPLIEDGDFHIPSIYMTAEEGESFAAHIGKIVSLHSPAERIPATGCNVIASKGNTSGPKIVICAHIDAKEDTPGALDNGTGVVVLLLLAELLQDYRGELGIEILAVNGEDYYSAAGEVDYLKMHAHELENVLLAINTDVAGYIHGDTAYSLYGCPEVIAKAIHKIFASRDGFLEGEPWYQSDHSVFIQQGRPALAITSERFMELSAEVTHTPKDRPELVDPGKVAAVALSLYDLCLELSTMDFTSI